MTVRAIAQASTTHHATRASGAARAAVQLVGLQVDAVCAAHVIHRSGAQRAAHAAHACGSAAAHHVARAAVLVGVERRARAGWTAALHAAGWATTSACLAGRAVRARHAASAAVILVGLRVDAHGAAHVGRGCDALRPALAAHAHLAWIALVVAPAAVATRVERNAPGGRSIAARLPVRAIAHTCSARHARTACNAATAAVQRVVGDVDAAAVAVGSIVHAHAIAARAHRTARAFVAAFTAVRDCVERNTRAARTARPVVRSAGT